MDLDRRTHRDHADHRGLATVAEHLVCLFGGLLEADRFERVVHATAGQVLHGNHGIVDGRVDHVGGTHLLGEFEFRLGHVDRDDSVRSGDPGTLHGRQPDPPTPDHGNGLAR